MNYLSNVLAFCLAFLCSGIMNSQINIIKNLRREYYAIPIRIDELSHWLNLEKLTAFR